MSNMDRIIDVFKQIIERGNTVPGFLFIICAILVGVFKLHWLIAGVNTMSKKELAKVDLDYLCKSFGILFGILGFFVLFSPFIFDFFNIKHEHHSNIEAIIAIAYIVFMVLFFNVIKKDRIYKKENEK